MHSDTEAIRVMSIGNWKVLTIAMIMKVTIVIGQKILHKKNDFKNNFREKQHESNIFDIYEITKFSYNNGIRTSEWK